MSPTRTRHRIAAITVFAIVVIVFRPSLDAGWVSWDDDTNFLANPYFRGLGREQLHWMWTSLHLGIWIPLSWMTLGANYLLFGMEPAGYHATNVLLHALNAVLLLRLGLTVLPRPLDGTRAAAAGRASWALPVAAAIGALAFAIHPMRVESVTWITERRDVLSGAFYLGTVLAFLRFADAPPARAGRWYVLALLLHAGALLAKGTAVTVPAALALLWWYPLGRIGGAAGWGRSASMHAARILLPFVALAIGAAIVVFRGLAHVTQLPPAGKLAVSAYSWCWYLAKSLWPARLSPLYAMPEPLVASAPVFVGCGVLLAAAILAGLRGWRRAPGTVTALLAFTVIIAPLLGLHQGGPQIVADRNSYNASFALALLVGGLVLHGWQRARAVTAAATAAATAAVLVALGVATWRQQAVWHDSESLWRRVLAVEPDNPHGHNNYGNLLMAEGRVTEAYARYARAVELRPRFAPALANLGVALAALDRTDEAIAAYQRALAVDSTRDDAAGNLGVALMHRGDLDGAIRALARAVQLNPANADAEVNWGNALVRRAEEEGALAHYARAVALRPDHADAELNWGVALARRGALDEAATHFRRAVALAPGNEAARDYLAQVERDRANRRR